MLDWDNLRLFLTIARESSLVAAAKKLAMDQTTVSRRLSALEEGLGARLFDRSPRGLSPTTAAQDLMRYAERVEAEIMAATTALSGRDTQATGIVRLATPEAFGTFMLAPNAHLLHQEHPALQLELLPESRAVSLARREADIAIVLRQPPRGRLVARRLIDYRLGLYASRAYLDQHGGVKEVSAIAEHPFVWYIDDLIDLPELRFLDQIVTSARTVFRSSSIAAQQAAVANGLGLGMLHVFAASQDPRLVRLLPDEVELKLSYWMVVHSDFQRLPRVRAVTSFIEKLVRGNARIF